MPSRLRRVRWLAGLAVLLAGGLAPARAQQPAGGEWVDTYVAAAELIRREVLRPDRCPHDPAAVVLTVGRDPQALARYVREQVAYEPQAGCVRGPQATLAARAGGDWDRAALLAALLGEAGHQARFRVVVRTPAQRQAVVDGFLAQPGRERLVFGRPSASVPPPPPSELLARCGVAPQNRTILAAQSLARWQRLIDEAYDAASVEAEWIGQALRSAGQALAAPSAEAWYAQLLTGASERVVVELYGGQVLDVSPEAEPLPAAQARQGRAFADVPANRLARLTLRLWMHVAGEGAPPKPVLLLERPLVLGPLFGQPIRLEVVPADAQAVAQPPAGWSDRQWYEHVKRFEKFQAVLCVGPAWEASKVFDLAGQLHDVAADGRIESAQDVGAAVNRGFGGLFGGGEPEAPPATRLESLVLEVELDVPARAPVRQQRLLVSDLRPGVSPVYHADLLASAGPISPASMAWMMVEAMADNAPILAQVVQSDDPGRFSQAPPATRVSRLLHEWQLARYALTERLLADEPALTPLAGPMLALWTTQLVVDDAAGEVTGRAALDVVWDELLLAPRRPADAARAFERNVRLGVASTVFESLLVRDIRPPAGMRGALAEATLFQLKGEPPVVRPPGADGPLQAAPLAAWAIARNETGRLLVLPGHEAPESWWSLNPATGATIGRGDAGEGQSAIEYLKITKMNLDNLKCFLGFTAGALQGQGSSAATSWLQCVTGANATGAMGAAGSSMQLSAGLASQGTLIGLLADSLTIMSAIQEAGEK